MPTQRVQTDEGEQPTQDAMVATELMKIAQDAATGMEKTIDDQMIACDYNAESRRMLHYAAKLGTGILNGPLVESSVKQSWSQSGGAWQAEIIKDIKPAARCVLPWDFRSGHERRPVYPVRVCVRTKIPDQERAGNASRTCPNMASSPSRSTSCLIHPLAQREPATMSLPTRSAICAA